MISKLDRFVLKSFMGPFVLTTAVVTFIFLTQTILKYIDELVGKGLGFLDFAELIFYFSMNVIPMALPLAMLLASLMTYGTMGEFNELTAFKSTGTSLIRMLVPTGVFALLTVGAAFFFNNIIVPKANLKAYSLLYDMRNKRPTLDLKEGVFYNGLPGYSIKVSKKFPDGKSLKGLMIYDHSQGLGNTDVIVADSGRMYTMMQDQYLVLELFDGHSYSEFVQPGKAQPFPKEFIRNQFESSKIVFSLASFDLNRTKEELFTGNRMMKNVSQLEEAIDSLGEAHEKLTDQLPRQAKSFFTHSFLADSSFRAKPISDTHVFHGKAANVAVVGQALASARSLKNYMESQELMSYDLQKNRNKFQISKYQKYSQAFACFMLFLIGAPLGAIIKKGGLGMPALVCIAFFIFYYVMSMTGEKWAKEGVMDPAIAIWFGNIILIPFGLFFLRQAKNDSRLFDADIYLIWLDKLKKRFRAAKREIV